MASFPSSIVSFLGFTSTHTLSQDQHASQHNSEQSEIVAIETKLGTGSSTPSNNTVLRGNGAGSTTYDQVHAATDISGILGTANGGTGTSSSTGSGSVVLSNSPSLSTPTLTNATGSLNQPTISDFTNANHNHSNVAGGGTLNAANALQAGSVSFANLLSTIFSGQVNSFSNGGSGGGTGNYVNLGGIKILWITMPVQSIANTAFGSFIVSFPNGFFSSIQYVGISEYYPSLIGFQVYVENSSVSTTSARATVYNGGGGTATCGVTMLVIGT